MLLSERVWRAAFGSDSDVVGSEMIDAIGAVSVVGVARLPPGIPGDPDGVFVGGEFDQYGDELRGYRFLDAIARIRPEYSVADARAEVNAFVSALEKSIHSIVGGAPMLSSSRMI